MSFVQRLVTSLRRERETSERELQMARAELARLNRRMALLLQVNRRLAQAADENAVAELALELPQSLVPLAGSALVRFDSHNQPMPVESRGTLDDGTLAVWHQYLASRTAIHRCEECRLRLNDTVITPGLTCPLHQRLPLPDVGQVICLPIERNGHEMGILGLFLRGEQSLAPDEAELLQSVVAEIAIAFENCRLRTRELAAFYDVHEALQQRLDVNGQLARVLARTVEASGADAGVLLLSAEPYEPGAELRLHVAATAAEWNGVEHLPAVEREAAQVLSGGEPQLVDSVPDDPDSAVLLLAPLIADSGPLGLIALSARRRGTFQRAQVRLVAAIAGQAALLAENARLYVQLQHQAIMAERGRLAREMHDGLAQTLGFLKMRSLQIARWIESGQNAPHAAAALRELAHAANEAYTEVRAALDGLRIAPGSFAEQLRRAAGDFTTQSGVPVELIIACEPDLNPPAQAHLLRIVQESLNNVRRHAGARHVEVRLSVAGENCRLLIADDGQGFAAGENIPGNRHGLRVIQERADLLGADLQVTSVPGAGTRVALEWPQVSR
jgi:signal transduction histidine kinase